MTLQLVNGQGWTRPAWWPAIGQRQEVTAGIAEWCRAAVDVADDLAASRLRFVRLCMERCRLGDWGALDAHDRATNNHAEPDHDRILASYPVPRWLRAEDDRGRYHRIWIITEADRSTTTVLWPDEY